MGKQKISVTIDENVLCLVERALESGQFRNRSHVVEFALGKLLEVGKPLGSDRFAVRASSPVRLEPLAPVRPLRCETGLLVEAGGGR